MNASKRICFVCLGNIVRSPLAEHLFKQHARQAGADGRYVVESAGTGGWHVGEGPDARMQQVAARHGLVYDHRGRQFDRRDLDRFDLILAMDRENRDHLLRLASTPEQRAKIHLVREFDPEGGKNAEVPDPYYGGMDGFERVYSVVERATRGLLEALEGEGGDGKADAAAPRDDLGTRQAG